MPRHLKLETNDAGLFLIGELIGDVVLLHEKIVENRGSLLDKDADAIAEYLYLVTTLPKTLLTAEGLKDFIKTLPEDVITFLQEKSLIDPRVSSFQSSFEKNLIAWTNSLLALSKSASGQDFQK